MVKAVLFDKTYDKAPFSNLYLFNRWQDIGFQKAITKSPHKRHHVRAWGLALEHFDGEADDSAFWSIQGVSAENEPSLWIGAATRDIGLSLTSMTFKITHATDPNTIAERDMLMFKLMDRKLIDEAVIYNRPNEMPARSITMCLT